jgi:hypothetical protein
MSQKIYRVTLTGYEEKQLRDIINKGKHGVQKRKRAQALLLANEGDTDEAIADRGSVCAGQPICGNDLWRTDLRQPLEGKERGHRRCVLSGEDETRFVSLVCMGECPKQL